jgi:hypothetical protein
MHSKVSTDWLPSYIKATPLFLEIFKMAGYFPDSLHIRAWNGEEHVIEAEKGLLAEVEDHFH